MSLDTPQIDLEEVVDNDQAHVWHHLTQHKPYETAKPPVMISGSGIHVKNADGKEFIDAVSGGVWTVNVGYGRERIANAVRDQLVQMCYFAGSAGNIPAAMCAKKLIEKMPGMSRVYYSNSGSEAKEKVYKMVRQLAAIENNGVKHKIIYRDRDYHGTTIGALSSCGQSQRKDQYGPFAPGFVMMPDCLEYRSAYGDVDDYGERAARELEKVILAEGAETVGAVVLEPITAGGGVIPPPAGYWETIQEICKKYNVLLHIDEVVCGLGRTGKWFGYQHYGVKPDFVTMAKGLASGYAAISCTVTTEEVFDRFKSNADDPMSYFRDISTFGGCASGPAAALENIRIIEDENLVENAAKMGDYLMQRLNGLKEKHEIVGDVRGVGLFVGVELVEDRQTKTPVNESIPAAIAADCMANGVIIGRTNRSFEKFNNTLCLSPALICTKENLDTIVDAIDAAIGRLGTS